MSTITPTSSATSAGTGASDIISNLANLLPTGTFLAFQSLAPLFTNDGRCADIERIMTSLLIFTFSVICFTATFTDSITTSSGKVYYGIVTSKGLYNPQFNQLLITGVAGSFYTADLKYFVNVFDFTNACLGVVVFDAFALLTPPVSTCFFPSLPSTIVKSVPLLVGIIASAYFSFAPSPRSGLGFALGGPLRTVTDTGGVTTTPAALNEPLLTGSAAPETAKSSV